MDRIYLDHAATTPLLPQAAMAMAPWLDEKYGNPSSLYEEGREAKQAIDAAREVLSRALGTLFGEIVFTSGGTEASNLAMIGTALANPDKSRRRILIAANEHHCVLETKPILERLGYTVQMLIVDDIGRLRLDELDRLLSNDVLLVACMHANNETGVLQPVREIGQRIKRHRALFFCDAVQTFLNQRWDVERLGADLVSVSAHKIGGPKGAGALFVKSGTKIAPILVGGGQERELRAGTENVAAIAGFAAAVEAMSEETRGDRQEKKREARDAFLAKLTNGRFKETVSDRLDLLQGHAHVRAPGIPAETLLIRLDRMGVSASSGAACSSGSLEPSHVLLAMGYPIAHAKEGLRFTFGHQTTVAEAKEAAERVNRAVAEIDAGA